MKRLITLMLAAVFVLGTVAASWAIHTQGAGGPGLDFNARGSWRVVGEYRDNWTFGNFDEEAADFDQGDFRLHQRARVWFDFTTADRVKAVLNLQMGSYNWGVGPNPQAATGGTRIGRTGGIDSASIGIRQLFVQFPFPNSDIMISAGKQGLALPGVLGSPLHDDNTNALIVSMPLTDMAGLTALWARLEAIHPADGDADVAVDLFGAIVPLTLEGATLTPYALYLNTGSDIDLDAWWLGLNGRLTMFDPVYAAFDFIYGDQDDASGWYAALAVGMKMDMFTPELFFAYASGGDDTDVMPVISPDYTASTFLFNGSPLLAGSGVEALVSNGDPLGTFGGWWAVGLKLRNISFIDRVTHTFHAMYLQFDNDEVLTSDDSLVELTFDTRWQMFEQLAAIFELGYIMPSFDVLEDDNAFKAAIGVVYNF
jgi:hypothetical protein